MKKPKPPDHPTGDTFQTLRQQLLKENSGVSFMIAAVLWPFVTGLAYFAIMPHWGYIADLTVLGGILGPMIVFAALALDSNKHKKEPMLDALARLDDPRVVELFMTRMPYYTPHWKPYTRPTLIRILPHLQRTDIKHLSFQTQEMLHFCLGLQDRELILTILTALPNIGTVSALPFVEPHAKGATRPSRDRRIQEAAQQCHAILTARVDSVTGNGPERTLLRAASAPTDIPDLLRPASSGEVSPAEQLLRAAS